MGQVEIKKNILISQCGEEVIGTYVNAEFIRVTVGKEELSDDELIQLGSELLKACEKIEPVKRVIEDYKKKYENNNGWDLGYPDRTDK